MGICLNLTGDLVLNAFMLAGLSATLATLLILAALTHPILATLALLLVVGALKK
jgi:hypothetical protein